MDILHAVCCGLDVHKKSVTACLRRREADGQVAKVLKTFGTMTADLLALCTWLLEAGCTHVAMESTGSYWKPVFNLLEGHFAEVLLVNPQHVKALPGRKKDTLDAEWLAELLQHGLLRGSFIPPAPIRELRECTRYRKQLIRARVDEANRIQKLLEAANLKLAAVAADILGVSGRAMLAALVQGATNPTALAALAKGRLRRKRGELVAALTGRITAVQRQLLGQQLKHVAFLDEAIAALDGQIGTLMQPYQEAADRLRTVAGIEQRVAEALIAELGVDMAVFPTAGHCASWAALCPGHHESAGRRRSGRTRKGNPWLKGALLQAAWAASRTQSYLGAQYQRLARRRGKQRAVVAVAHSLLIIVYHILKDGTTYRDLGHDFFDKRDVTATQRRLVRRLEALGFEVTLKALPQAA